MKKKFAYILIPSAYFLISAFCHHRSALQAQDASARLHALTQSMFQEQIVSSTLNLHYTLEHPENYGITDYPVTYDDDAEPSLVQSAVSFASDYRRALYEIPCRNLPLEDQITYDVLMLALENENEAQDYALYQEPLGATIGIQAQLPVLLCEYTFQDREDVEEYLELIAQTDTYFSSLLQFEKARARAGLFMSDDNADAIIRQCRSFIGDQPDSNFLITIFDEKAEELPFLSEEEKDSYKSQNRQAVQKHVLAAYELLAEGLETLKGSCKNENGLCYFPSGKAYYEYLVRSSTGSYLPIEAIEKRIRKQISDDILACRELLKKYPGASRRNLSLQIPTEPEEILADLQDKMSGDYPKAPNVSVDVKYVHPSLEEFLSPAFYLTPPIDDRSENVIYINNASVASDLERYTTLAHEGYPGHLYQNISSQDDVARSLFSFGGFTEGWATYVEMESYAYAAAGCESEEAKAGAEFARLNRSAMLGLSSLLDICIHYHGYMRRQTAAFLNNLGFAADNVDALYDAILESPANYLKYDLGYLTFADLRSYCEKKWPQKFNLTDFHAQILRIGPAPFPVVEKYLKRYYRGQ